MGKLRARTEAEVVQRRESIIESARELFLGTEYEDLSLGSIAEALDITRPSLYNYFSSKEALFLELTKREYLKRADALADGFRERTGVGDFCGRLYDVLMSDELFAKLMSLHQAVMETKAGREAMESFKRETLPFFRALEQAIGTEFPDAAPEGRALFAMQVNVLLATVHAYGAVPEEQREVMEEIGTFGDAPAPTVREFYVKTLEGLASAIA